MIGDYYANLALQTAVSAALESYGLDPIPTDVNRRPQPARTFAAQLRRATLGSEVFALVRQSVPVGEDDRRLIYRLVDSACQRLEDGELLEPIVDRQDARPAPTTTNPTRRPTEPSRPSSPTKTNPTRAIRSSRWNGKAVRS